MKRRMIRTLAVVAVLTSVGAAFAVEPAYYPRWWVDRDLKVIDADPVKDFAGAQRGQAKWIARCAVAEFDAMLVGVGGAGPLLRDLDQCLPVMNNSAPLNLGQLKNLAKPFYDRLQQLADSVPQIIDVRPPEVTGQPYPWTDDPTDDENYARALIGQVKYAFSFNFDRDSDGLPDWWEKQIVDADPGDGITAKEQVNPQDDFDGDGANNLAEYADGTRPTKDPDDIDGDGFLDLWENTQFGSTSEKDENDLFLDPDSDDLSNLVECWLDFNPNTAALPAGAGVLSLVVFTPCE